MVYLFLADGFEEIEAVNTTDVLRRGGIDITTVSIMNDINVRGAHDIMITADALFEDVDFSDAIMLILPGGMPGTLNLGNHTALCKLLCEHNDRGGWIAAICAAPSVLGKLHILENHNAVCYPGFEQHLIGANLSYDAVMLSRNIITSRGPACAIDFGLKIIEVLKGSELSKTVADNMIKH